MVVGANDLCEDVLRPGGPDERLGIIVVHGDVLLALALTGIDPQVLTKTDPQSFSKVANFRLSGMSLPAPHDRLISTAAASERHRDCVSPHRRRHVWLRLVSRVLARANGGSVFREHRRVSFGER